MPLTKFFTDAEGVSLLIERFLSYHEIARGYNESVFEEDTNKTGVAETGSREIRYIRELIYECRYAIQT